MFLRKLRQLGKEKEGIRVSTGLGRFMDVVGKTLKGDTNFRGQKWVR